MKNGHEYTREIVCPWCGYEFGDSWEICPDSEDIGLEDCPECEKEFYATRHITVEYSTQKAKYGTCSKCGSENVVVESGTEYDMKYVDLCERCKGEHRKYAIGRFIQLLELTERGTKE